MLFFAGVNGNKKCFLQVACLSVLSDLCKRFFKLFICEMYII